jgi:hypothetical protein
MPKELSEKFKKKQQLMKIVKDCDWNLEKIKEKIKDAKDRSK